jgi:succinate dehydrogenase / fumarate reductase membrane anchor subunit
MRDRTLWTWHIFAGVVILVFLGLHMTIMHLNGTFPAFFSDPGVGEPESWQNVAARAQSLFFTLTYVVMLGAALYHGLFGLRGILLELNPGAGLRKGINVALSMLGLALFAFGAWVAIAAPGVMSRMGG